MLSKWPLFAALAVFAVHSLSYGAGFVADPGGMVDEFGAYPAPSEAAENLTGLVGVLMLLMGSIAALGAYWVARFACKEGAWLAVALSAVTLSMGAYWVVVGRAWDAGFYSVAGFILGGLAWWLLRDIRAVEADHIARD